MKRALASLFFAGSLALLCGCESFDHIEFVTVSTPVQVFVTYDSIEIPEGVAVIATARPVSGSGTMSEDTKVELSSDDAGILGVSFALPDSAEAQWTFVLSGAKAGTTTLSVRVDDDVKKQIPATITAQ